MLAWLLVPLGILMLIYTRSIGDVVGDIDIADRFGGIYDFVKLIGLGVIVFGFLIGSGFLGSFLQSSFGKFFAA